MRKKAIIIGNCQASAIGNILQKSVSFNEQYQIIIPPPVHIMTKEDIRDIYKIIPSCDLLICQIVSENYRDSIGLGTKSLFGLAPQKTELIKLPVFYISSYNPELFYFKNKNGSTCTDFFDYHSVYFFYCFMNSIPIEQAVDSYHDRITCIDLDINTSDFSTYAQKEEEATLKFFDFICENFKKINYFTPLIILQFYF